MRGLWRVEWDSTRPRKSHQSRLGNRGICLYTESLIEEGRKSSQP